MKIDFIDLLTLALVVLKLTHQIHISWFWVFAPMAAYISLWIGLLSLFAIGKAVEAGLIGGKK